jgi:two-component system OmpR family response regulator
MKILLVEDDPRLARNLMEALHQAGFVADHEPDGREAWFRGDVTDYDAVILDLGLPSMDGLAVLKRWRAAGRVFPILVLTARGEWTDRVEGIEAGADDYLPKPFQMEEVLARLRALLRRAAGKPSPVLTFGDVAIDTRAMTVAVAGQAVDLTPQEYRLLSYLAHNAGRAVSQAELLDHIYAGDSDHMTNSIEVLVGRLRRKIGVDCIGTRRGFGYVFGGSGP